MRYILLFSDGSINVGAREEASRYLVRGRTSWRAAISSLALKVLARNEGKITNLEIQSHGQAARIVTSNDDIDYRSVASFGASLRPLMAPGSLIEIMACLVASIDSQLQTSTPSTISPAAWDEYWNGYEKDPVTLVKVGDNYAAQPIPADRLENYRATVAKLRAGSYEARGNGVEFCLTLARTSGAIVRAARLVQSEEYGDFERGRAVHPIMRDYDRFGDWEGPVWDFMPNGSIKYLGANLPRARSRFPITNIGPQLTYNFREQGGNDSDIGQRPQRMNRSPLPV